MLPQELIFDGTSDAFEINAVERHANKVVLHIISKQPASRCPDCDTKGALHSYYFRKINDLPAFGYIVMVALRARKFYCRNSKCSKKVFSERFPDHFLPYKRSTKRLNDKLLKIALLMGGNAGKKLCDTLNIPTSSSSLIRNISQKELHPCKVPTHIGIDDWAYKKGHTYGTAIIDLKARRIIDLLPDRESSSVENWLSHHGGIKIVTRDRYAKYARGVTKGAPSARQVADRWHLLKNMGDSLKKLLERKRQELRRLEIDKAGKRRRKVSSSESIQGHVLRSPFKQNIKFVEIKKMYAGGYTIRSISKILGVSRNTIRKYIYLDEPPRKNRPGSQVSKFSDYFKSRIKECPNIEVIQLWKEIKEKGYNGSRSAVYEFLKAHTRHKNENATPFIPLQSWSPSKVSLLLYRDESGLSKNEQKLLVKLKKSSPDIGTAHDLVRNFRNLIENKQGKLLKRWIKSAMESTVQELRAFAKGLLSDFQAVKNAFTLPWSNGPVEGQINKLKTIKRQMYGRASFSLLRKRMILGSG